MIETRRTPIPGPPHGDPGRRGHRSGRPPGVARGRTAARAVEYVGLPEAALNLAEAVIYLARAPKSTRWWWRSAGPRPTCAQRQPGSAGAPARRPLQGRRHPAGGGGEGYVYPHDDPWGRLPSSIVLTHSRVGCTTSRRPTVRKARVWVQAGTGRSIREPGTSQGRATAALGALTLGAGIVASAVSPAGAGAGAASSPSAQSKVVLPQADARHPRRRRAPGMGAARPGPQPRRGARREVRRAGAGGGGRLDPRIAAYRQYLAWAQYARPSGRPRPRSSKCPRPLRAEGLTVGTPDQGAPCCR